MGCGSGYVICSLALLLKALGLSCQLLAVDINSEATAAASKTLANHGVRFEHILVVGAKVPCTPEAFCGLWRAWV